MFYFSTHVSQAYVTTGLTNVLYIHSLEFVYLHLPAIILAVWDRRFDFSLQKAYLLGCWWSVFYWIFDIILVFVLQAE